ncbi:MAG: thermonuclease family protein [Nitrospiraceae bacterium]
MARITLSLLTLSPAANAVGAIDESRSDLRTYTPAPSGNPTPFSCNDCWPLKPEERSPLPQHTVPHHRRSHHERGPRPHKNPFAKKSQARASHFRLLPHYHLGQPEPGVDLEQRLVRAIDGDTLRYGAERIRIRGYNAPERSEPGGLEATLRLQQLLHEGSIRIVLHGRDVYGRRLADVFIDGENVADVMTAEGFGRKS